MIADAVVVGEAGAPYAPGLLALREGPMLEASVRAAPVAPHVLLVDAPAGITRTAGARATCRRGPRIELGPRGAGKRPVLSVQKDLRASAQAASDDDRTSATRTSRRGTNRDMQGFRADHSSS